MTDQVLQQLRFPVGKLRFPETLSAADREPLIATIAALPDRLAVLTQDLTPTQQNWIYRPGGWTIRQVVHHLADSHLMSFSRFKLALTEVEPTISPYREEEWARQYGLFQF